MNTAMPSSTSTPSSTSAPAPLDLGMVVLAAIAPTVAVFASKGLVVVLGGFAALGAAAWLAEGRRPRIAPAMALLLGALVALGAASSLWAKDPAAVLSQVVRFVGLFSAGILALGAIAQGPAGRRARLLVAFAIGQAVAMALLLSEFLSDGALMSLAGQHPVRIFHYSTGVAALALFVWPAALALGRRTGRIGTGLLMLCAMTAIGFQSASLAVGVALACGIAAAIVTAILRKRAVIAIVALMGAGILAAPLIADALPRPQTKIATDTRIPHGVFPRLLIWSYVTNRIAERPIAGWGLNTSRTFSTKDDQAQVEGPWQMLIEPLPLHPHNAALQWWLELGLIGACLGAATVGWIALKAGDLTAGLPNAALGIGLSVTALIIAGLSFGAWQSWWLATFWIAAAMTAAARERGDAPPPAGGG